MRLHQVSRVTSNNQPNLFSRLFLRFNPSSDFERRFQLFFQQRKNNHHNINNTKTTITKVTHRHLPKKCTTTQVAFSYGSQTKWPTNSTHTCCFHFSVLNVYPTKSSPIYFRSYTRGARGLLVTRHLRSKSEYRHSCLSGRNFLLYFIHRMLFFLGKRKRFTVLDFYSVIIPFQSFKSSSFPFSNLNSAPRFRAQRARAPAGVQSRPLLRRSRRVPTPREQ